MMNRFSAAVLLGMAAGLVGVGCDRSNHPPEILTLTANPPSVCAGGASAITAVVTDVDEDSLEYNWSATGGIVMARDSGRAVWLAPQDTSYHRVELEVVDPDRTSDTASVAILVGADNRPVIRGMTAQPETVGYRQVCSLSVDAYDPDGSQLSYRWQSAAGVFHDTASAVVAWEAPLAARSFSLTVTVSDSEALTATDSILVLVTADTLVVIDTVFVVYPGGYRAVQLSPDSSPFAIQGSFAVETGDINFFAFDEENYDNWQNQQACSALVSLEESEGACFLFSAADTGDYFLVLDNKYDQTNAKEVELRVLEVTP